MPNANSRLGTRINLIFIAQHKGMFSVIRRNEDQVDALRRAVFGCLTISWCASNQLGRWKKVDVPSCKVPWSEWMAPSKKKTNEKRAISNKYCFFIKANLCILAFFWILLLLLDAGLVFLGILNEFTEYLSPHPVPHRWRRCFYLYSWQLRRSFVMHTDQLICRN